MLIRCFTICTNINVQKSHIDIQTKKVFTIFLAWMSISEKNYIFCLASKYIWLLYRYIYIYLFVCVCDVTIFFYTTLIIIIFIHNFVRIYFPEASRKIAANCSLKITCIELQKNEFKSMYTCTITSVSTLKTHRALCG